MSSQCSLLWLPGSWCGPGVRYVWFLGLFAGLHSVASVPSELFIYPVFPGSAHARRSVFSY